jgi:DNA sulfur modification protein DndC
VFVPGPFTLAARQEIFDGLLALESKIARQLISPDEIARIKTIWADDASQGANWATEVAAH